MKVKTTHATDADKASAKIFFNSLLDMYDVTGPTLDMFARNGELTVASYRDRIKGPLDLWELGEEHKPALEAFKPREIKIGCSYASSIENKNKYEMVVIDTPQGLHYDVYGNTHFEHFSLFDRDVKRLLADRSILVLYCNKQPYDKVQVGSYGYDEYDEYNYDAWMHQRRKFYHCDVYGRVNEEGMIDAYRQRLEADFKVGNIHMTPCFSDVPGREPYAFRLGIELIRHRTG